MWLNGKNPLPFTVPGQPGRFAEDDTVPSSNAALLTGAYEVVGRFAFEGTEYEALVATLDTGEVLDGLCSLGVADGYSINWRSAQALEAMHDKYGWVKPF